METGIQIGGNVQKETVEAVSFAIERILRAGFETHAEQDTIQSALGVLGNLSVVQDVEFSHNVMNVGDGRASSSALGVNDSRE